MNGGGGNGTQTNKYKKKWFQKRETLFSIARRRRGKWKSRSIETIIMRENGRGQNKEDYTDRQCPGILNQVQSKKKYISQFSNQKEGAQNLTSERI